MCPLPSNSRYGSDGPLVGDHVTWPMDVVLHPDHSMTEALRRMQQQGRSFAPVVDGDAIVGVLSLGLVATRSAEERQSVRDCMLPTVPFLYEDDPLALGASIVAQTEIEHFCVVDRDHLMVGVLALSKDGNDLPVDWPREPVDPALIRRRLAVTPGRAASAELGILVTYAEGPTLYVDGRAAHEPLDRPRATLRKRREAAMKSKL